MILQQEASNFKGTLKVLPEIWAGMHRSLFIAVAFDEFTGDLLFEESRTEKNI
jgi:hypothetical protein